MALHRRQLLTAWRLVAPPQDEIQALYQLATRGNIGAFAYTPIIWRRSTMPIGRSPSGRASCPSDFGHELK